MSTPRDLCSCVLHVCILHICNRTGVRAGVEAVWQGSGIHLGGGLAGFAPGRKEAGQTAEVKV